MCEPNMLARHFKNILGYRPGRLIRFFSVAGGYILITLSCVGAEKKPTEDNNGFFLLFTNMCFPRSFVYGKTIKKKRGGQKRSSGKQNVKSALAILLFARNADNSYFDTKEKHVP